MKLALGPLQYFWPRENVTAFYQQACDWPVDIVYLGEVVCAKRRDLRLDDWLAIANTLREAGKEVVLSTLVLLEADSELKTLRRIVANRGYAVEANDMAAVNLLEGHAYIAGPHLNIYNPETLTLHYEHGAQRWVMPVELTRDTLQHMQQAKPARMQTEVFGFGRLPLAFSARCFSARAHKLPKDDCRLCCGEYPDGLAMDTRDHQAFLVINGIQTQSATTCNLIGAIPELQQLQVDVLRMSPQSQHMQDIVQLFHEVIDGQLSPAQAEQSLNRLTVGQPSNGFWRGDAGMNWLPADALRRREGQVTSNE